MSLSNQKFALRSIPSAGELLVRDTSVAMNFRSTFSQIVWLQVLAVAATTLIMPIAIYLFLERTVADYQVKMLGQREQVLQLRCTGRHANSISIITGNHHEHDLP